MCKGTEGESMSPTCAEKSARFLELEEMGHTRGEAKAGELSRALHHMERQPSRILYEEII